MNEKRTVAKAMTARYRKASKKEKGRFLDEFVALTGYHRRYAVGLLHGHGQTLCRGRSTKRGVQWRFSPERTPTTSPLPRN